VDKKTEIKIKPIGTPMIVMRKIKMKTLEITTNMKPKIKDFIKFLPTVKTVDFNRLGAQIKSKI
jgi:hypothetical protein